MKNIFTLLLLSFMTFHFADAQCEFESYPLDDWEEVTSDITDALGVAPEMPAYLPENWAPLSRLFSLIFLSLDADADTMALANNFFGLQREVVDAEAGNYAMCISTDSEIPFADAVTINLCEDEPINMVFDMKYQGSGVDTLRIFYLQGENFSLDELSSLESFEDADLSAFGTGFVGAIPDEYNTYTLPITKLEGTDTEEAGDTILIWILTSEAKDAQFSYCVDNVRFEYESTSTNDNAIPATIQIGPNPASDFLDITVQESDIYDATITNLQGQEIYKGDISNYKSIDISSWPSNSYNLILKSEQNTYVHRFIKL